MPTKQNISTSLKNLTQFLESQPQKAKQSFKTISTLESGFKVKTSCRHFDFIVDEPKNIGGTDTGPNPVELILGALGACQIITYQAWAALEGIELEDISIETSGDIDFRGFLGLSENVRPGFQTIKFDTQLTFREHPEKIAELTKKVEQLCPVLNILTQSVKVEGSKSLIKARTIFS